MPSTARRTASVPLTTRAKDTSRHQSVNCMKVRTIYMFLSLRRLFVQQCCVDVMPLHQISFLAIYTWRADNTYVHVICSQSQNPLYEKFPHQPNVSTNPRKGFRDVALDLQVNPDLERNPALWYATCRCLESMSYFVQVILARHSG